MKPLNPFCIALMVILITAAAVPVQAEDEALFLSTDSADYRYSVNEEPRIPVTITNNLGSDLPGTLVVQIYDPRTGEYVYSQSKQITAFSGEETYYITAGNSGDERDILVDISFEYGTAPVYTTELKGISLSISSEVPPDDETAEGTDTDTGSAPVKSTSDIKTETPDISSYASTTTDAEINAVEKHSDADALKRTLLEEQIEREMRKNALNAAIKNDTLFQGLNRTLYDQNFTRLSFGVISRGNSSGIFSSLYRDTDDEEVSLSGTVEDGRVAGMVENTTAAIALPPVFLSNDTFRDIISETESEGFEQSETTITISPRHSDIEILYKKGIYSAEVRAESVDGNVTAVSLIKDDILPFYILPLLILLFTALNAAVIYAYYRYRPDGLGNGNAPAGGDDRQEESDGPDILSTAESLFSRGQKKEAVSIAVRALRMKISAECFGGREVSDSECMEFLLKDTCQKKTGQIISILASTEQQRFSEEDITEEEFRTLTRQIRILIEN